jgi:hypothetical protein
MITLLLIYTIYNHSILIFSVCFHWSSLSVSWQLIYNTVTIESLAKFHTPNTDYFCAHKVFKSHVNSSQADFLRSSVLLQLRNSAHLYKRGTDTDLQKTHHVIAIQPVHWRSGLTYRKHMLPYF